MRDTRRAKIEKTLKSKNLSKRLPHHSNASGLTTRQWPGAGRKHGTVNRFSEELLAKASQSGTLPVEHLFEVMPNRSIDTRLRINADNATAPYVYQRLLAISVDLTAPDVTHGEWLKSLA